MNDGKLVLEARLKLLSPLHIGSGENDATDLDIIKDSDGKPFITFTSFIGALKHHLCDNYNILEQDIENIFGYSKLVKDENETKASVIIGSDFFLAQDSKFSVYTRDGIKIKLATGIVDEGAKYDYQVVDRGAEFTFVLESSYGSGSLLKEKLLQYYSTIIHSLKNDDSKLQPPGLRIGAKTNNGLGKITLINEKVFDYDFSNLNNVIAWLNREHPQQVELKDVVPIIIKEDDLVIVAYLNLKTSLIQRSYNDVPSMPDSSHMQSGGQNILAGSGTKGAIAARGKKILNTIWDEKHNSEKDEFIKSLFGFVDNDKKGKPAVKSRMQIEERELPDYVAELQSRIKIDRFTGGTINGAFFDSMPLFNTNELNTSTDLSKKTRITIRIKNCTEAEAGLMFLILKDLWTGDLAIGGEKGIGRGVFNGVSAFIKYKKENPVELTQGLENLSELQKYVDELIKSARGEK